MKKKLFELEDADVANLEEIKRREGITKDVQAVRLALNSFAHPIIREEDKDDSGKFALVEALGDEFFYKLQNKANSRNVLQIGLYLTKLVDGVSQETKQTQAIGQDVVNPYKGWIVVPDEYGNTKGSWSDYYDATVKVITNGKGTEKVLKEDNPLYNLF